MVLTYTPAVELDMPPPPFSLTGTDGEIWTLSRAMGPQGLLVMFICNHCPYVQAIITRLVSDCIQLQKQGIGCIAIMPNDTTAYPDDDFAAMISFAQTHHFPFPYVLDETQAIAHAYGAVCTPDFFGYNAEQQLKYRGRFDQAGMHTPDENTVPELRRAMLSVAQTGTCPAEQHPSMGCSIKWRH